MPSSRRGKWAGAGWPKSAFGPRLSPAHPTQKSSLRSGLFLCQTESDFQMFPTGEMGRVPPELRAERPRCASFCQLWDWH